jgi:hypothetical protein
MITVLLPGVPAITNDPAARIRLADLADWTDSVDKKLDRTLSWPNRDGESDQDPVYDAARYPVVSGSIFAESDADLSEFRQSLMALKQYSSKFTMEVTDSEGTLQAEVQLAGKIRFTVVEENRYATFSVPLLATDPVKYSAPRDLVTGLPTAGGGLTYPLFGAAGTLEYGANGGLGRVTASNTGDARVWPIVTVSGELASGFFYQRLDTGETIRYDRVVPLGSTVSVDHRTGEVLIDGDSDGSTYLTRFDFFSVGPGEAFDVQFNAIGASSGTPEMTVTVADGYF